MWVARDREDDNIQPVIDDSFGAFALAWLHLCALADTADHWAETSGILQESMAKSIQGNGNLTQPLSINASPARASSLLLPPAGLHNISYLVILKLFFDKVKTESVEQNKDISILDDVATLPEPCDI